MYSVQLDLEKRCSTRGIESVTESLVSYASISEWKILLYISFKKHPVVDIAINRTAKYYPTA